MNLTRCDNCGRDDTEPLVGWLRMESMSDITRMGDPGPIHFCSWLCVSEAAVKATARGER